VHARSCAVRAASPHVLSHLKIISLVSYRIARELDCRLLHSHMTIARERFTAFYALKSDAIAVLLHFRLFVCSSLFLYLEIQAHLWLVSYLRYEETSEMIIALTARSHAFSRKRAKNASRTAQLHNCCARTALRGRKS